MSFDFSGHFENFLGNQVVLCSLFGLNDLDFDRLSLSFLIDEPLGWMLPGRDAPLYHDKPYASKAKGWLMRGRQKIALTVFALIIGAVLWWQYTSPPTLDWSTSGQSVSVDELQVRLTC